MFHSRDSTSDVTPYALSLAGFPRGFAVAGTVYLAILLVLSRVAGNAPWADAIATGAMMAVIFSYRPGWWTPAQRAATLRTAAIAFVIALIVRFFVRLWL